MLSPEQIAELNDSLADATPKEILQKLLPLLPNTALSFSGAEDVVLIEMTRKLRPELTPFTLDTGRLHPQTYQYLEQVRKHYSLDIELLSPDAQQLQQLVKRKGLFSFYEDGHEECCGIRKVEPLRRKLATVDAWITGQRRDQSPSRAAVPIIEIDPNFSTQTHSVIKLNPLANWSSAEVWNYIRMFELPYNSLHDGGYVSIGCEPCTRAVGPNAHEREGRWWWEEATIKECGLHRPNSIDAKEER